ncbi:MAG: ABC transporter substrate-binding protein [Desulfosoma sp.]|uniref:ABC transporter substrate-binding protein n=1 Tax=Desulfosoma sp. TaxID=2603217 RepID=UPI004049DB18
MVRRVVCKILVIFSERFSVLWACRSQNIFLVLWAAAWLLSPGIGHGQQSFLTYTDKFQRTVKIHVPVSRAVLTVTYELIPVLRLWDRIVGVSRWAEQECEVYRALVENHPEWRRPHVGTAADMNVETMLALRPDLVVTWATQIKGIDFLEKKGIPIIAVYPDSLEELFEMIRLHGRLFGVEQRAAEVLSGMERLLRRVRERTDRIPPGARRKVVYVYGNPTTVVGGLGLMNEVIALIGADNPASSLKQRTVDVPLERILGWKPDVVFIWGHARYGEEEILGSPLWQHVEAVRQNRVYKLPKWSAWSPRLALAALWMAQKTYPEMFADLDLDAEIDAFHQNYYGISYRSLGDLNLNHRLSPAER